MGSSSSKMGVQTYSYNDISSTALFNVASSCKGSANSNQEFNFEGTTITNSRIIATAKQRLECLSTVSSDQKFDNNFQNELDNLIKQHSSVAIGSSKTATEIKNEIVTQMRSVMESNTSSELFGSTTQNQVINMKNMVVTNSDLIQQADAFVKTVSTVLSQAGMKGEVAVKYKNEGDNTATNAVSDLGNNVKDVWNNAIDKGTGVIGKGVDVVGDTAGGVVDTAKTAVTGVLDIVGSPFFLIIVAVIVIVLIYIYLSKSPAGMAMGMGSGMGVPGMGAPGMAMGQYSPYPQYGPPAPYQPQKRYNTPYQQAPPRAPPAYPPRPQAPPAYPPHPQAPPAAYPPHPQAPL